MFKRKPTSPVPPPPLSFNDILSDLSRLQAYNKQALGKKIDILEIVNTTDSNNENSKTDGSGENSQPLKFTTASSLIEHLNKLPAANTPISSETLDATYDLCTNFINVNDQLLVSRRDLDGLDTDNSRYIMYDWKFKTMFNVNTTQFSKIKTPLKNLQLVKIIIDQMSSQSFTKKKENKKLSTRKSSGIIPLPISVSNTSFTNTFTTFLVNRFPFLSYYFTSSIQESRVKTRGNFDANSTSVIVSEKQAIQKLWKQGFFGKGNLSRSEPTFEWRDGKKGDQPLSAEQITQNRRIARARRKKNKKNASASITNNEDSKDVIDVSDKAISIQEHLQLTTEEAFFLSFGLGCLEIYDANDNLMTTHDCWNAFRISSVSNIALNAPQDSLITQLDNPFILRYVVYHYFRSLGWVVRSGMKFGCDYVLYEKGPEYKHAEYCVIVLPYYLSVTNNKNNNHFRHNVTTSWQLMSNLSRVCVQVKKSLVLCYVIIPPSLPESIPNSQSHEQVQLSTSSDNNQHHVNDENNYGTIDLNNPFE
ncbi:8582_t:CDS:10, partial [Dentiscutata erythropus]